MVNISTLRNSPALVVICALLLLRSQTVCAEDLVRASSKPVADPPVLMWPRGESQARPQSFPFASGRLGQFRVQTQQSETIGTALASRAYFRQPPSEPKPDSGEKPSDPANKAPKRRPRWGLLAAGGVVAGIGAALMATRAEERQQLVKGGDIPCQDLGSSWTGYCHYEMEHNSAFLLGGVMVVWGGLLAIVGAVGRKVH